jgi:tetratricopeptide (TPR) repeat protein
VKRDALWGLALVAAVVLVYLPVGRAGFIWDDELVVTANPCVVGPLGLKEIWTTQAADICPLTISTFWLEHQLWGLAPLPYHLVNVLLHAAGAVALWRVLRRLKIPGAWLGAALWAVHPVQVESVAWVSEMKNTESGLFFLLTILFFLRGRERVGWNYGASLLFAALAMTSKSSTVILPPVLLLCAWWSEGRWSGRQLAKVAPMLVMALAVGLVSIWTQSVLGGTDDPHQSLGGTQRLALAGDAVWFYLRKTVWPQGLMLIYPRWEIDASSWTSYLPSAGVLAVLAILWGQRNGWGRGVFFAWAYFLLALLPVLGFVNMSFQVHSYVSDHFQYLADMGPSALFAAGATTLARAERKWRWLAVVLAGLLAGLGIASGQRAALFQDEAALWADTLAKNPDSWGAHNNLGDALLKQAKPEAARVEFVKALQINPEDARACYNLGRVDDGEGNLTRAVAEFQKAIELNPGYFQAYNNFGVTLLKLGRVQEAMGVLQQALAINPVFVEAMNNLGIALGRSGRLEAAAAMFQKSLAIHPSGAEAHNGYGNVLAMEGRIDEAIGQFREALRLRPGYPAAQANLERAEALAAPKTAPH